MRRSSAAMLLQIRVFPGLKRGISTPRTKTCPRGPRTVGEQKKKPEKPVFSSIRLKMGKSRSLVFRDIGLKKQRKGEWTPGGEGGVSAVRNVNGGLCMNPGVASMFFFTSRLSDTGG